MKCPKCGYLGFDTGDRCKNCGYDFSLTPAPAAAEREVPLRDPAANETQLFDVPLTTPSAPDTEGQQEPDLDRLLGVPEEPPDPGSSTGSSSDDDRGAGVPPVLPERRGAAPPVAETHLPLFSTEPELADDDRPLITPPSGPPRRPVAVRRATSDTPRRMPAEQPRPKKSPWNVESRPHPRIARGPEPALDLQPIPVATVAADDQDPVGAAGRLGNDAPSLRRLTAAALDTVLFAGIDAAVLYFTMRIAGLSATEVGLLPVLPLAAFLLLLKIGYLTAFTAAGGQTIGKMAAGLRASAIDMSPVRTRTAVVRSLLLLATVVPAGLLWLPSLVGTKRGLHDRAAGTRVVLTRAV